MWEISVAFEPHVGELGNSESRWNVSRIMWFGCRHYSRAGIRVCEDANHVPLIANSCTQMQAFLPVNWTVPVNWTLTGVHPGPFFLANRTLMVT